MEIEMMTVIPGSDELGVMVILSRFLDSGFYRDFTPIKLNGQWQLDSGDNFWGTIEGNRVYVTYRYSNHDSLYAMNGLKAFIEWRYGCLYWPAMPQPGVSP